MKNDMSASAGSGTREVESVRHFAGWLGIETAPRDGRRLLLVSKPSMGMGIDGPIECGAAVHIGYWNPDGSAWVDECGSFDGDAHHLENTGVFNVGSGWLQPDEVTHWMELPEIPQPSPVERTQPTEDGGPDEAK